MAIASISQKEINSTNPNVVINFKLVKAKVLKKYTCFNRYRRHGSTIVGKWKENLWTWICQVTETDYNLSGDWDLLEEPWSSG